MANQRIGRTGNSSPDNQEIKHGSNSVRISRQDRASVLLLTIPLLVWGVVVLYLCRVTGFVLDRLLLKAPGIYVSFAVLALCPLAAVAVGWRLAAKRRLWGRGVMGLGGIMTAAFVMVIGIPLVQQFFEETTPRNPGSPRPLEPLVGLPVFPGAEGFGTRTPAGRGGQLIEVTSLADSGPGTLRAALDTPGPRIIVFRTGGTIELQRELYLFNPFVTVAGQTAPGDGICIKNCGLVIAAHDVLIQHVRFRPGNEGNTDGDDNDAIKIFGRHGTLVGAKNVVLDHISASWSEDEVISTWFGPREITICWSIISEGLDHSRHRKGTHSAGLLIGDSTDHASVHHNLLAHNSFRNPLIVRGGTHDIVNNVIYNWGELPAEVQDMNSNSFVNFISNKFIAGPGSVLPQDAIIVQGSAGTPRLYVEGNLSGRRPTNDLDQWAVVTQEWHGTTAPRHYQASRRFAVPRVTASSADEALSLVLEQAGATQPQRDAVDGRVVSDVMSGTGAIIDSPSQVGGYPQLSPGSPPRDSDHDGMPDVWEQQRDLDPHDPSDANQSPDPNGYTNIELYLHSLCQPLGSDKTSRATGD